MTILIYLSKKLGQKSIFNFCKMQAMKHQYALRVHLLFCVYNYPIPTLFLISSLSNSQVNGGFFVSELYRKILGKKLIWSLASNRKSSLQTVCWIVPGGRGPFCSTYGKSTFIFLLVLRTMTQLSHIRGYFHPEPAIF